MPLYQRCVHLGCRVPYCGSSKWFECPCHGSKYNGAGEYKLGPAPRGMDRFKLEITDGNVVVDTSRGDPRTATRHRHDRPATAGPVLRGDRIGEERATVMLAATNTAGVVLLVLGAIFVLAAGAALYFRSRQKEQPLDIPRGMRPGPADAALETPLLQKLQGWGVVLVAFFVIFIPYNWLRRAARRTCAKRRSCSRSRSTAASSPCRPSARRTSSAWAACAVTAPSCAAA